MRLDEDFIAMTQVRVEPRKIILQTKTFFPLDIIDISTPQGCHRLKSGHLSHIRGFAKYYYSNVTRCTTCHREGRGRPDTHEKERVICY